MRISDWSSDVCSSDLRGIERVRHALLDRRRRLAPGNRRRVGAGEAVVLLQDLRARHAHLQALPVSRSLDRALDAMADRRSDEHTSELQSLMRISYAAFCLITNTQSLTFHGSNTLPHR